MEYKNLLIQKRNAFLSAIEKYEFIQEKILFEIIRNNTNTIYGTKHQFKKIKTIKDFQKYVPITTYEDYIEYIEQIKSGNNNVLTKENILLLEPTSGSTGINKLIPYNEPLKQAFNRGIEPWLSDIFLNHPELMNMPMYWSITPKTQSPNIKSKIRIGFDNDLDYLNKDFKEIIQKNIIIVPNSNKDEFINKTAQFLSKIENIGLISIWNPYLLILILENSDKSNNLKNTKFISCWDEGNSKDYARLLKDNFPNSYIQGKGLLATEGIMTIPIEKIGKVPCIESHFYEFIDIQTNEIKLLNELEKGKEYSIIITTQGGLYRYKIGDIIKCYDKYKNCPLISFQSRANNISDYTGEKLNEEFIKNILNKYNISNISKFYMFAPQKYKSRIGYVLYIELTEQINIKKLKLEIERELQNNFHYKYSRELKQLEPFRICIVKYGMKQYIEKCIEKGQKLGNIKPKTFSNSLDYNLDGELY